MSMGTWKKKLIKKQGKRSVSTGKSKGIVSTPLERTICRRNRSYKMREYAAVMNKLNGEKHKSKSS